MRKRFLGLAITAIAVLVSGAAVAGEIEDNATAHLIAGNLKSSGVMKGYKIGVTCKDGVAWLTGTVTSNEQGEQALQIASETEGVTEVVNQLTFVESAPAPAASSRRTQPQQPIKQTALEEQAPVMRSAQPMPARQPAPRELASPRQPARQPMSVAARHPGMPGGHPGYAAGGYNQPIPAYTPGPGGIAPARYDNPQLPGYAWPSYAPSPNYAALTYPQQYSPTAWPYIGPFYPYPQVPLGWRKVTLEWDDGWWMLDFND